MDTVHVEFGQTDPIQLNFAIRHTVLAKRWQERLILAQEIGHTIDEPDRFYGLADPTIEIQKALSHINHQIKIINQSHPNLILKQLTDINDQDTLNYLHNIFEEHHGLLDQQIGSIWTESDATTRIALARLNTAVHRCESVYRGNRPRCVVTYYGLPKTEKLTVDDYDLVESGWKFGTLHLCYVEIGKTLIDLAVDDDHYIGDDAFKPFEHFSADFVIQFNDSRDDLYKSQLEKMWTYFDTHRQWFESRGWHQSDPQLKLGIFPIADLTTDLSQADLLDRLRSRQWINRVWLS